MLATAMLQGASALCGPARLSARSSEAASLSGSSACSANSTARSARKQQQQRSTRASAAVEEAAAPSRPSPALAGQHDPNYAARIGSFEAPLVEAQASKDDPEQPSLAGALPAFDLSATADVAVVGAGPAGLALAAELAQQGLSVALVSPEAKFVNNYGVWLDEFREIGLEHTLDAGGSCPRLDARHAGCCCVGSAFGSACGLLWFVFQCTGSSCGSVCRPSKLRSLPCCGRR